MADSVLQDIRDSYEYDTNGWQSVRKEAKKDMRFVAGQPFDLDDLKQRKDRPTIAPDELSQYRNQVTNGLMAIPRGMKFLPRGNGASPKGAEFYQNKARETEYRSHATQQYILAADNALQRGYGFVRLKVDYAEPRAMNQDIFIEGFPNPDMVLPDCDALRPDSADMKRCLVYQWMPIKDFNQTAYGKKAKVKNVSDFAGPLGAWVKGTKLLVAEAWRIKTRPRTLVLVTLPAPVSPQRMVVPNVMPAPAQRAVFEDELDQLRQRAPGLTVDRALRDVDYPEVKMYLTNGIEILEEHDWLGKHIPIVSCYGKVLYVDGDQGLEREILSMTRFGRDPWKAYCYACSQELEVLGGVPRVPLVIPKGSMDADGLALVARSMYEPVAALIYDPFPDTMPPGAGPLPPPQRAEYVQAEYLQAIEVVKEGFRRAIQAAMGSNFLPTQAQKINDKSGVALDKIDAAATMGTRHFVNSYEDMIRQVGVIFEDLCDKVHDYAGDVDVILPDMKSQTVSINTGAQDAISTKGDYLVTVSTAPSSDSEYEAAAEFTDLLVSKIDMIANTAGPKAAAAILAQAIRMRNLGPMGDQIASIIEPPEYQSKDGQPPDPKVMGLQQQLQQATQMIQKLQQDIQGKVQEQQAKGQIELAKKDKDAQLELELKRMDIAAKILMTRITAAKQSEDAAAERAEERLALGVEIAHDEMQADKQQRHDRTQMAIEALHEHVQGAHTRVHEAGMEHLKHAHVIEQIAAQPAPAPHGNGAGA